MYKRATRFLEKFIKKSTLFKYGFNLSPLYRRTTGRVYFVSDDLLNVKIKIPLTYRNSNYMGTMFGGSMASATDPFYMIQLINILGDNYVVWDKSASIKFKRPGTKSLYADFKISNEFLNQIKEDIQLFNEANYRLMVNITDQEGIVYAEVEREVYIAFKEFYKTKMKNQNSRDSQVWNGT